MYRQVLITTLLLGFVLATAHQNYTLAKNARIITAFPIDISKVPFHVEVRRHDMMCGGSILSKDYIITAALCTFEYPVDQITVFSASNIYDKGPQSKVLEKYECPRYYLYAIDCNVAILKVNPLNLSKENSMLPVTLPPLKAIWPPSSLVSVTGWGVTKLGNYSKTLLQTVLTIQDRFQCKFATKWTDQMLCVGDPEQSSCIGNSGSPLVLLNSNILVGIVSFERADCGDPDISTVPAIYMNVAHQEIRQFIKEKTGL